MRATRSGVTALAIAGALSLLPRRAAAEDAPPPGMARPPELPEWMKPKRLDYEKGDPIPPRYELKTQANRGLLIGGSVIWGTPYALSFVIGSVALIGDGGRESEGAWALLVPVAGPYMAINTMDAEGSAAFWLAANGVMQTAGVVMIAAAYASESLFLERRDGSPRVAKEASLRPRVLLGPGSAALRWQF